MNINWILFTRLAVLTCTALGVIQGQEFRVVGTFRVSSPEPGGQPIPRWNGSGLTFQDHSSVVTFVDPQGPVTPIALTIPDMVEVHAAEAGHVNGGAFVLGGWAVDRDKRIVSFLAFAYADGRPTRIVRLNPYALMKLEVAQDGSLWTYGNEQTTPGHLSDTDAGMIRHFDAAGNLLGSYLPQSSIDKKEDMRPGIINFGVAANRAGWYYGVARFYFEVADGKVQKYPGIPESVCGAARVGGAIGLALTDNGGVFVTYSCGNVGQVFALDRALGRWVQVDMPNGEYFLVGGEHNNLVFHSRWDSHNYVIIDTSEWSPR